MSTRNPHASTEQLADLLAGVLPDAEAGSVAAHASECAECGAVRDRLADLPGVLAAVPAPALPAEVKDRLDAAIVAESDRRAAAEAEAVSRDVVVVPLRKVRRDRVRHWFAGAASAAAVLVAISVAADVVDLGAGSGDAGSAADNAGADAHVDGQRGDMTDRDPDAGAESATPDDPGTDNQGDGEAEEFGRLALPEVAAEDFADDVELLYDSGAFRDQRKLAAQDFPPGVSETDGLMGLVWDEACGTRALERAVGGKLGPFVLLDQQVVRLVADGPAAARLVQAYSCDDGTVVRTAVLDLSR